MDNNAKSYIVKNEEIFNEFYKLAEEFSFNSLTVTAGNKVERFFDLYKILYGIGKGGFAIVVAAEHLIRKEICAIKIIRKQNNMGFESGMLHEEANILKSLNHPNIIQYIEVHETEDLFFIVTELMQGGSLSSLFNKRIKEGKLMNEEEIRIIMKQIFEGIRYIHSCGILHRDIKLENILLKMPEDLSNVKIIDFGIGTKLNLNSTFCDKAKYGTFLYMAPEQIRNNICIPISDLWSCGIMIFFLISGKFPYPHSYDQENNEIILEKMSKKVTFPLNISFLFQDLFQKLCTFDPIKRYSAEEALNHPFITNKNEPIPLTLNEQITIEEQLEKIKTVLILCIFIGNYLQMMNLLEFDKLNPKLFKQKRKINFPKISICDTDEKEEILISDSNLLLKKSPKQNPSHSYMKATSSSKNLQKEKISENIYVKEMKKSSHIENSQNKKYDHQGSNKSEKDNSEEEKQISNLNKEINDPKFHLSEKGNNNATPKMKATLNQFTFKNDKMPTTPRINVKENLALQKNKFSKFKS